MKKKDARIKELIDFTKVKYGLDNYYLQRHKLYRNVNIIDVNIHSRKFESAIFVCGGTFASGVTFSDFNANSITTWVEQETGLIYQKQFQLHKEEGELLFKECFNSVMVSPSGSIEIKFDLEGNLIFFAVHGQFPILQKNLPRLRGLISFGFIIIAIQ